MTSDGADRIDPRVWRAVLTGALAKSGDGLLVCDKDFGVLFSTARAVELLRRVRGGDSKLAPTIDSKGESVPVLNARGPIATLVKQQIEGHDPARKDRLATENGGAAIYVNAVAVRGAPPAHVAIWLREEVQRDEALYPILSHRFGVTRRGWELAQLVRKGLTNRQIGERLQLAEATVKVYLHQLYRDCGVPSRTALIALLDDLTRGS